MKSVIAIKYELSNLFIFNGKYRYFIGNFIIEIYWRSTEIKMWDYSTNVEFVNFNIYEKNERDKLYYFINPHFDKRFEPFNHNNCIGEECELPIHEFYKFVQHIDRLSNLNIFT